MGECGCSSNDRRFTFPAPGKDRFYMLTLSAACPSCDSPPGIMIELIDRSNVLYDEYMQGEFIDGPLKFEKLVDTMGVAIVTGMRKHEFVKALSDQLVGTPSRDLGDSDGIIDKIAAETLLEEMYEDSLTKPHFPKE